MAGLAGLVLTFIIVVITGGDTHTVGQHLLSHCEYWGSNPYKNSAPNQTMFVILIDPFCCNQTSRLSIYYINILIPICLHCLNCTKFGQLVFRKIINTAATRCQTLKLKCTKFGFRWGSVPPRLHWGSSQRSPRFSSWI